MAARVLIGGTTQSNVKLLESKLAAADYEVVTAHSGLEAIAKIDKQAPDIVIIDAMTPSADGLEVCRRVKVNPITAHIPVVMVTALDQPSERLSGLEAGADDFLTKPMDDMALFARIRSVVRLKLMADEVHARESISRGLGLIVPQSTRPGQILLIEDRPESVAWFSSALRPANEVTTADTFERALARVQGDEYDAIIVNLGMRNFDGLQLCSQLRSLPVGRNVPILVFANGGERHKLVQALEMGVNDYLARPVDKYELIARVRTLLRKKRLGDRVRDSVMQMNEMARYKMRPELQQLLDKMPSPTTREIISKPLQANERQIVSKPNNVLALLFGLAGFLAVALIALTSILIPALFISGAVIIGVKVLPWLAAIGWCVLAICVIPLLPLACFRSTRGVAGMGYLVASCAFGACVWFYGLLLTYFYWGFIGLFIGLFVFGVGVVPEAMLAALLHGRLVTVAELIVLVILTFGTRMAAKHIEMRI